MNRQRLSKIGNRLPRPAACVHHDEQLEQVFLEEWVLVNVLVGDHHVAEVGSSLCERGRVGLGRSTRSSTGTAVSAGHWCIRCCVAAGCPAMSRCRCPPGSSPTQTAMLKRCRRTGPATRGRWWTSWSGLRSTPPGSARLRCCGRLRGGLRNGSHGIPVSGRTGAGRVEPVARGRYSGQRCGVSPRLTARVRGGFRRATYAWCVRVASK
jgi:hypothetical protein